MFFGTRFGSLESTNQSASLRPAYFVSGPSACFAREEGGFQNLQYSKIFQYPIVFYSEFSFMRMRKRIVFMTTFQNKKFSNDCWTLKRVDDIQNSVRKKLKIMTFSHILSFFPSLVPKKKQRLARACFALLRPVQLWAIKAGLDGRRPPREEDEKSISKKKSEFVKQYFCFLFLKTYEQFCKKRKQKAFVRSCTTFTASHKRKLRSKRVCE